MIRNTINEAIAMGLLVEDGNSVGISPDLDERAKHPRTGDALLPSTIASLMFAVDREGNHNLADAVAWYLAQNPYLAPGGWSETELLLQDQGAATFLEMTNDARYSQFKDWSCFLGFAWRHELAGREVLTPDPTAYLRQELDALFGEDRTLPIGDLLSRLASRCPLFETGVFRERVESVIGRRPSPQHLSSTTALALLRLQDEKRLELTKLSDAAVFVFPIVGEPPLTFSHVARVLQGRRRAGAQ